MRKEPYPQQPFISRQDYYKVIIGLFQCGSQTPGPEIHAHRVLTRLKAACEAASDYKKGLLTVMHILFIMTQMVSLLHR